MKNFATKTALWRGFNMISLHPRDAAKVIFEASRANRNRLRKTAALAIDATPEDFQISAFSYSIDGAEYVKAAATGISFTAAHIVEQGKFGAILVEIDTAGTVTTKIGEATQTTLMGYDTSALAVAALPSETAGKRAIGYIVIEANSNNATLTTALAGANNDLVYTAVATGAEGNDVTIAYIDPAANDAVLDVVVTGTDIVVNLATDGGGTITTTADDIKAAIALDAAAVALVGTVVDAGGNDGSGLVIALAETALAGGSDTGWTANTDDMTDASDVTEATFNQRSLTARTDRSSSWEEQTEAIKAAQTDDVISYLASSYTSLPSAVSAGTYVDPIVFQSVLDALAGRFGIANLA
jgi:hypothetical protein